MTRIPDHRTQPTKGGRRLLGTPAKEPQEGFTYRSEREMDELVDEARELLRPWVAQLLAEYHGDDSLDGGDTPDARL